MDTALSFLLCGVPFMSPLGLYGVHLLVVEITLVHVFTFSECSLTLKKRKV